MRHRKVIFSNFGRMKSAARNIAIAVLFFVSFFLFLISKFDRPAFDKINSVSMGIVSPIVRVVSAPFHGIRGVWIFAKDVVFVYSENKKLRHDNLALKKEHEQYNYLRAENEMLSKLLKYSPAKEEKFITAKIVSENSGRFSHSVVAYIKDDGSVKKGQVVLNENGVVGRVENVSGNYARIMLISGINSKIPVVTEQGRIRGILAGNNTKILNLLFTPLGSNIEKGDMVVTSGVAGGFPSGLAIGVVYEVEKDNIKVQPLADLSRLEYVQIVDYGIEPDSLD